MTNEAIRSYRNSSTKAELHGQIKEFAENVGIWELGHKDHVLENLVKLIEEHPFQISG